MTILFLSVTFLYTYLGIQKIFLYFCESAILLSKTKHFYEDIHSSFIRSYPVCCAICLQQRSFSERRELSESSDRRL